MSGRSSPAPARTAELAGKHRPLRTALVHDWLVAQRGGEQVLLHLARSFPRAPIYTLVHAPGQVHPELERHPIRTSFIQHLPGAPGAFRSFLPLFPAAVAAWDLSGYDLVVSTSHCVAKAAPTSHGQVHIAYIHTPMRYLWDQLPNYVPRVPGRKLVTRGAHLALAPLRSWDVASAQRPDLLVANSQYVADRIARVWGRRADVVHPPVDVDFFARAPERQRRGYLVVSALVPYKRVEVAVVAATRRGFPLRVVGDGPERAYLQRLAGPTVQFLGPLRDSKLREEYARAEALLFCGVEDFGMVPVEAMAAGCPVIALGQGGALETVSQQGERATGVLFKEPDPACLLQAIDRFTMERRHGAFACSTLSEHARRFAPGIFTQRMGRLIAAFFSSTRTRMSGF